MSVSDLYLFITLPLASASDQHLLMIKSLRKIIQIILRKTYNLDNSLRGLEPGGGASALLSPGASPGPAWPRE